MVNFHVLAVNDTEFLNLLTTEVKPMVGNQNSNFNKQGWGIGIVSEPIKSKSAWWWSLPVTAGLHRLETGLRMRKPGLDYTVRRCLKEKSLCK